MRELCGAKALHWSLNGKSKMPLQVKQDFTGISHALFTSVMVDAWCQHLQ